MIGIIKRYHISAMYFLLGVSFVLIAQYFVFYFGQINYSAKNISSFESLAKIENKLRHKSLNFEKSGLKTYIKRMNNGIVLNVWEDNLFPISHWKINSDNYKYFEDIAAIVKNSENDIAVKVVGHYDSVNPHIKNTTGDRKVILTKKRAATIAKILLKAGVKKENIKIVAGGDKSPLVRDRDSYGTYLSNRGRLNRRLELYMELKNKDVL